MQAHDTCKTLTSTLSHGQEPLRPPPTALDALRAVLLGGVSFLVFMVLFIGGSYYARRQVCARLQIPDPCGCELRATMRAV